MFGFAPPIHTSTNCTPGGFGNRGVEHWQSHHRHHAHPQLLFPILSWPHGATLWVIKGVEESRLLGRTDEGCQ